MHESTYNHIKQLIVDSGLLKGYKTPKHSTQKYPFNDECILITGAAGSIGSELTKQVLTTSFKTLILVDVAESPLYNLYKELENEDLSHVHFLLLNITETDALQYLFETFKPTLVFHAAAYKHVPLMEAHPYEAVKTNILATKYLVDLAIAHKTRKFIFISTDKAVNPISVMGLSKRIAEMYILQWVHTTSTLFSIARFGNIMGSNGSVLPLFIKQIEAGLPVTVTNHTIARYFISKPKACQLILQLATFNNQNHHVFTFNMGKPIKIIDIATCLISLYPEQQIDIKMTGLRPGEKQEESIVSHHEALVTTDYEDIYIVQSQPATPTKNIDIHQLKSITPYQSPKDIKVLLQKMV